MFERNKSQIPEEPSALDFLKQKQQELAITNPNLAAFNLDNRDDLLAFGIAAIALKGNSVELKMTDVDGKVETVSVEPTGTGDAPLLVSLESSDGIFSPELAEMASELEQPHIDEELDELFGTK